MLKVFAGISLIQGAFFGFVSYGMIANVKNVAFQSGLSKDHSFFVGLETEATYIYLIIMLAITISTLVFSWLGLQWTHDAVGAIYHLKKDIDKMATTKKLHKVKLRKNDYFKDFEKSFNDMVDSVSPHAEFEADADMDEFTPTPKPTTDTKAQH